MVSKLVTLIHLSSTSVVCFPLVEGKSTLEVEAWKIQDKNVSSPVNNIIIPFGCCSSLFGAFQNIEFAYDVNECRYGFKSNFNYC